MPVRVLVVDDVRDIADTLAVLLGMKGHIHRVAYESGEAIRAAAEFSPELVILDLAMPKIDGLTLVRTLRAMPEAKGAYFAAVTGYADEERRQLAESAGFDRFIVKPISVKLLDELLAVARERRPKP